MIEVEIIQGIELNASRGIGDRSLREVTQAARCGLEKRLISRVLVGEKLVIKCPRWNRSQLRRWRPKVERSPKEEKVVERLVCEPSAGGSIDRDLEVSRDAKLVEKVKVICVRAADPAPF